MFSYCDELAIDTKVVYDASLTMSAYTKALCQIHIIYFYSHDCTPVLLRRDVLYFRGVVEFEFGIIARLREACLTALLL